MDRTERVAERNRCQASQWRRVLRLRSLALLIVVLVLGAPVLVPAPAAAQGIVDFEPDPMTGRFPDGSLAVDEMLIGDQFLLSHGIRFGIDEDNDWQMDGALPQLEQGGRNIPDAFKNGQNGLYDRAEPGFEGQLGEWLLKADLIDGQRSLLVQYKEPVSSTSGQIWDIDGAPSLGYEQWRVEIADVTGRILDHVDSPAGFALELDGKPWNFGLTAPPGSKIKALRIVFIGHKSKVGLAFDRFSPSSIETLPTSSPVPTIVPTLTTTPTAPVTETPVPTPTHTRRPTPSHTPLPTVTRVPVPDNCVCQRVLKVVPPAVVNAALAQPALTEGWQEPLNPNKPIGPDNPLRECLNIIDPAKTYHPLFNGLVWRVGCN